MKSNILLFNASNIVISINDHALEHANTVKYLGVHFDDKLSWSTHVAFVTKLCSQRIGVFKKIMPCLPQPVLLLYYNAFIRSCFSYCLMFWINNARSGRQKLVDKIDHLVANLANNFGMTVPEFITKYHVMNIWSVYKMQCLSLMYDISNNIVSLPFFPLSINATVHGHFTRSVNNIHLNNVSALDHRNFVQKYTLVELVSL